MKRAASNLAYRVLFFPEVQFVLFSAGVGAQILAKPRSKFQQFHGRLQAGAPGKWRGRTEERKSRHRETLFGLSCPKLQVSSLMLFVSEVNDHLEGSGTCAAPSRT